LPSYKHGKVERLKSWLEQSNESLDNSAFYSDSHNDIPLLNLVSRPVAVNPDYQLMKVAKENGWDILDWR
jgi:phosphoserine phosphatase